MYNHIEYYFIGIEEKINEMYAISDTENIEMKNDEENRLLIDLIQGYLHLYAKKDSNYKNKNMKEKSWQEISKIMNKSGQLIIRYFLYYDGSCGFYYYCTSCLQPYQGWVYLKLLQTIHEKFVIGEKHARCNTCIWVISCCLLCFSLVSQTVSR